MRQPRHLRLIHSSDSAEATDVAALGPVLYAADPTQPDHEPDCEDDEYADTFDGRQRPCGGPSDLRCDHLSCFDTPQALAAVIFIADGAYLPSIPDIRGLHRYLIRRAQDGAIYDLTQAAEALADFHGYQEHFYDTLLQEAGEA